MSTLSEIIGEEESMTPEQELINWKKAVRENPFIEIQPEKILSELKEKEKQGKLTKEDKKSLEKITEAAVRKRWLVEGSTVEDTLKLITSLDSMPALKKLLAAKDAYIEQLKVLAEDPDIDECEAAKMWILDEIPREIQEKHNLNKSLKYTTTGPLSGDGNRKFNEFAQDIAHELYEDTVTVYGEIHSGGFVPDRKKEE